MGELSEFFQVQLRTQPLIGFVGGAAAWAGRLSVQLKEEEDSIVG